MMSHNKIARNLGVALIGVLPACAQAVINQVNESDGSSQTYYTPSSTDLLNQGQASFISQTVSGYTPYYDTSTDALNDGLTGSPSTTTNTAFDLDGVWTSIFNLNTTLHPLGYDINSVQTITGWPGFRINQSYRLSYAPINAPTRYISLGTFSYSPGSLGDNGASRITLNNASTPLVKNVVSLKFDFLNAGTVYREVDAFGSVSLTAPLPPPPIVTKIMPLGDSITRGSSFNGDVPGGYRTKLQQDLTTGGKYFDMVGSNPENPPPASLDADHNGYNGWRIDSLRGSIDNWLTNSDPDMILLHIGTNDMLQNYQIGTLVERLDDLVGRIVLQDAHAQIFVASIIPIMQDYGGLTAAQFADMVDAYNAKIPGIVSKYALMGDNVHFVDMHNLITLTDANNPANNFFQNGDGIHPGQAGYNQMGDIWYNAVQSSVPEPGSLTLLAVAAGMLGMRRRNGQQP